MRWDKSLRTVFTEGKDPRILYDTMVIEELEGNGLLIKINQFKISLTDVQLAFHWDAIGMHV